MKTLVYAVLTIAPLLGQDAVVRPESGTAGGNASIAQGILGFGVPSSPGAPEPCVGTGTAGFCYGVPAGLLVVPTNLLVPAGTAGVFYLSLETADFSGTADTTLWLLESGTVVLRMQVAGSAISANAKTIIAKAAEIPAGTYTGPATLTASTTVTPQGGGTPITLTATTQLYIVPHPSSGDGPDATMGAGLRIAQGFVGFAVFSGPTTPAPCVGSGAPNFCYGVPADIAALPLDLIIPAGTTGGAYYVSSEVASAHGGVSTLYQVVEDGRVALQFMAGPYPFLGNRLYFWADEDEIPAETYTGPVTVIATTTIAPGNGEPSFPTLTSGITLQIVH
jgi:hypothetical protein